MSSDPKAADGRKGDRRPAAPALAPAAALAWCVVVVAAYHAFNYAYYREKITVFARFLIGLIS